MSNLHMGHRAAMDLMPYQLDPSKLALKSPRQRILIADTVGLGKTLEAGILMSELIARGKGKRILVVTVKSMMTQFQKEMWNRFTIPLVRLDSSKIQKIRASLPSNYNPFFYYDKTIVSIDTLKRDVEYRTHLENAYWDIIVIDEAQNVAERGDHQAQRSRLAKLLADRSDTMIMLSATPHDGRAKSFASLMNMLDPTAIADPENYTKDDIKGLCIRRFKKDVKDQVAGSFLERNITLERCHASVREEQAYDIFAEMQLEMDLGKSRGTGQLFKTSLEKSLFSSPAACLKSIDARLKKLYKKYSADDIKDIRLLEELRDTFIYRSSGNEIYKSNPWYLCLMYVPLYSRPVIVEMLKEHLERHRFLAEKELKKKYPFFANNFEFSKESFSDSLIYLVQNELDGLLTSQNIPKVLLESDNFEKSMSVLGHLATYSLNLVILAATLSVDGFTFISKNNIEQSDEGTVSFDNWDRMVNLWKSWFPVSDLVGLSAIIKTNRDFNKNIHVVNQESFKSFKYDQDVDILLCLSNTVSDKLLTSLTALYSSKRIQILQTTDSAIAKMLEATSIDLYARYLIHVIRDSSFSFEIQSFRGEKQDTFEWMYALQKVLSLRVDILEKDTIIEIIQLLEYCLSKKVTNLYINEQINEWMIIFIEKCFRLDEFTDYIESIINIILLLDENKSVWGHSKAANIYEREILNQSLWGHYHRKAVDFIRHILTDLFFNEEFKIKSARRYFIASYPRLVLRGIEICVLKFYDYQEALFSWLYEWIDYHIMNSEYIIDIEDILVLLEITNKTDNTLLGPKIEYLIQRKLFRNYENFIISAFFNPKPYIKFLELYHAKFTFEVERIEIRSLFDFDHNNMYYQYYYNNISPYGRDIFVLIYALYRKRLLSSQNVREIALLLRPKLHLITKENNDFSIKELYAFAWMAKVMEDRESYVFFNKLIRKENKIVYWPEKK